MTILHVSDLHFNRDWYRWLARAAPPHDLLVLTGDLLDLNHPASHARQAAWTGDWVREWTGPLALCSGNHDRVWDSEHEVWRPADWLRGLAGPSTWVDGQSGRIGHRTFFCHSGRALPPAGATVDVWITHLPPLGPGVGWHDSGHGDGDPELLYQIRHYRPLLVLCGHIHSPLSWIDHFDGTIYLNPGCDPEAPVPNHLLIDLHARTVTRHTAPAGGGLESETVHLPAGETLAEPAIG